MKKLFAIVAVIGAFTFGSIQLAQAQDAPAAEQTEQQAAPAAEATTATAPAAEEGGIHKEIKTKFIEGTASFMSLVAIALVIGLAFCIERIIYLSLAEINTKNSWHLSKLIYKKVMLKLPKTLLATQEARSLLSTIRV